MELNITWFFLLILILARAKQNVSGSTSNSNPVPIILDGKPLPFVERVEHLGHILQANGSMEADACRARASFMAKADDISSVFLL